MTTDLTLLSQVAYRGKEITSARLRGLLALLADDLRTGCSTARLIDGLWPDDQPDNPTKALQILISRARTRLGSDLIATTPTGYRLALTAEQVDSAAAELRASACGQHARAGEHGAALEQATAGLALWDGAPDVDGSARDPVSELRAARSTTYRTLTRTRALALSRLGRADEALEPLTHLFEDHPHDEELLLELLRSEAATAGPSAALARYERYRRELRDELGTDPGSALQALHEELLRATAPAVRRGVTHEPNPLLGRHADIEAVKSQLHTSRVTSITGPGGLGKTRLAHAVLRDAEQHYGFFVPLAGVTTDDDVVNHVASAIDAGESRRFPTGRSQHDLLRDIAHALSPGPALLVLDNCEHVVRGAAELVTALVSLTDDVRIVTTSRAPLGLSSESVYLLPELTLTTSVELFTQRARAARPDVDLPSDVVTDLCKRLDGLPLAVELAAARVRVMSVAEIARRLDDRFSLLRGGMRDTPERHQTLHAVVEWSWNLLPPAGQAAMRALAIFPDGFTADAARWLLDGDVLTTLDQLVERSMLKATETPAGMRFRMLETVRQFSAADSHESGDEELAITNVLAWARDVGLTHHEAPFGPDPYRSVELFRNEQDNLAAASRYALARGDAATVAAVTAVLASLWIIESNYPRLSSHVDETSWLLSHYRPPAEFVEVTRTALLLSAACTLLLEGPRATRSLAALLRLPPAPPTTFPRATATIFRAAINDADALGALCFSDEPLVAGGANGLMSYSWETDNDLPGALAAAERMLEAFGKEDAPWLNALAHSRVGELCFHLERGDQAHVHLTAALPIIEALGARSEAAGIRWWVVLANLQRGAIDEAERSVRSLAPMGAHEAFGTTGYDVGARAEVHLAKGEVDDGLRQWRCVVETLRTTYTGLSIAISAELDPWPVEARCVAVIAHAHHDRIELVEDVIDELPERMSTLLGRHIVNPPLYLMELPLTGTLLVALAMAKLVRGQRAGDSRVVTSAVRMIALAERFGYLRNFQPTMSSTRIRETAERADAAAYATAVTRYADLDHEELRAAAGSMLEFTSP